MYMHTSHRSAFGEMVCYSIHAGEFTWGVHKWRLLLGTDSCYSLAGVDASQSWSCACDVFSICVAVIIFGGRGG